jgi:hypothetical protein
VVHDYGVIVTRVGDVTYACRKGRTREVGTVTDIRVVSDREVAYTTAGATGVLNLASGKRPELDGPGVSNSWTLLVGGDAGVRAWPDDQRTAATVADGPATDVALSDGFTAGVAYSLAVAGNPRSVTIA